MHDTIILKTPSKADNVVQSPRENSYVDVLDL